MPGLLNDLLPDTPAVTTGGGQGGLLDDLDPGALPREAAVAQARTRVGTAARDRYKQVTTYDPTLESQAQAETDAENRLAQALGGAVTDARGLPRWPDEKPGRMLTDAEIAAQGVSVPGNPGFIENRKHELQNLAGGIKQGRDTFARGVLGLFPQAGTADTSTPEGMGIAPPSGKAATVGKFGTELLPWVVPGIGLPAAVASTAGGARQDALERGAGEGQAWLEGLGKGTVAALAPKVVTRLGGGAINRLTTGITEKLAPYAGDALAGAASRTVGAGLHGAGTGIALPVGNATVSALAGDKEGAINELKSIPTQMMVMAALGAGSHAIGEGSDAVKRNQAAKEAQVAADFANSQTQTGLDPITDFPADRTLAIEPGANPRPVADLGMDRTQPAMPGEGQPVAKGPGSIPFTEADIAGARAQTATDTLPALDTATPETVPDLHPVDPINTLLNQIAQRADESVPTNQTRMQAPFQGLGEQMNRIAAKRQAEERILSKDLAEAETPAMGNEPVSAPKQPARRPNVIPEHSAATTQTAPPIDPFGDTPAKLIESMKPGPARQRAIREYLAKKNAPPAKEVPAAVEPAPERPAVPPGIPDAARLAESKAAIDRGIAEMRAANEPADIAAARQRVADFEAGKASAKESSNAPVEQAPATPRAPQAAPAPRIESTPEAPAPVVAEVAASRAPEPARGDRGATGGPGRVTVEGLREQMGKLPIVQKEPKIADAAIALIEARANAVGKSPNEWIGEKIAGIRDSRAPSVPKRGVLSERSMEQNHGAVEFLRDGRAIIHAFETATPATPFHELGHVFRRDLSPQQENLAASWSGAKPKEGGGYTWTRSAEEKFARGFERYLRDGKAPTPGLKGIFEQFKVWMQSVYKSLLGSPIQPKLSDEMRGVFDSLFSDTKQARAEPVKAPESAPGESKPIESSTPKQPTQAAPESAPGSDRTKNNRAGQESSGARPEGVTTSTAEKPSTGIKNEVTDADRKRLGLPERETPEGRTFDEMYDAGKEKAAADPTAINRLLEEMRRNPEKVISSDTEAGLLLKHKVDQENELHRLIQASEKAAAEGDLNGQLIAKTQLDEHRAAMKEFTELVERAGTAAGRALVARKMMSDMDYSLSSMEATAEAAKGSKLTPMELKKINVLYQEYSEKNAAAEKALAAYKTRLGKQIDTYEARLEDKDYAKPEKRKKPAYDAETLRLQAQLEGVKRQWNAEVRRLERESMTVAQKAGSAVKAAPVFFKSIKASLDNSAVFRQGWRVMFTNPVIWQRNARQTFVDAWKTLGGKEVMDEVGAELKLNPYYEQAKQAKLAIGTAEEDFPTSLPGRVPLLGRVYKASENAYTAFQYRNRMQIFEKMLDVAKRSGHDISDPKQLRSIGKLVNSLTGRGSLGKLEPVGGIINNVFFSGRKLKADLDFLSAHSADMDFTAFARTQAAQNLAKVVAGTALIMLIAKATDPDSIEFDPRSANFGKIKSGNTRFDISGGAAPIITLAARLAMGSTKSSVTGKVTEFNQRNPKTGKAKFGSPSKSDAVISFFQNKLSPFASVLWSHLRGQQFDGKAPTLANDAQNLLLPMAIANFDELMNDTGATPASVATGVTADFMGIGTNTYDGKKK